MTFPSKTYHSQLYRNFRAIDAGNFRQIMRFYEKHEKAILQLSFSEYFDMLVAYTNALFEIGAYRKHILMADVVIETVIIENVDGENGQDIFRLMLFRKAASHYNLLEYRPAIYVLTELLKINPDETDTAHFLERCLRDERPQLVRHTRATAIFLFLMSTLIIFVEVLFVRHFYPDLTPLLEISRNTVFVLGLVTLIVGAVLHRYLSRRQVHDLIKQIKKQKRERAS
jgi:hypothetical protein